MAKAWINVKTGKAYTLDASKVYYTKRHRSGVQGYKLVPHDVVRDQRGWYYAVIDHDGKTEFRKVSYRDVKTR